jgi:uncharacterized protein YpiB (UPF0302 family)
VRSLFQVRSLTELPVSETRSRVEVNISNDSDVENSDESLAFSVVIDHKMTATRKEIFSIAIDRALDILSSQRFSALQRQKAK